MIIKPSCPASGHSDSHSTRTYQPGSGHDLASHVAWLRDHVAPIPGPVVVCTHSYGGAVVGEALADLPNVRAAIFVAAFVLEVGESCRDANPGSGDAARGPRREGDYLVVPPEVGEEMFYLDAAPAERAAVAARLTPEHVRTVTVPVRAAGWHRVPTTYVTTERDRALPLGAQQRMAARTTTHVALDSDHSPMFTQPARLAAVVRSVVADASGAPG